MRMLCKKFGKWFLLLVPLLLGAWGLIGMEGEPVLDALYQSICMYAMGYQETPPNLAVELARWTAPLATASGVLLAFVKVRDSLWRYARYLRGNSVAVYGPKERREALMDRHDLGIHTEMLTASMGKLLRAGVVNNARKNFNPGRSVATFVWGDQPLYDYLAENTSVCLRRAAWVNDPFHIAQNDNMVSVNTALQIDLTGQVCSESIGPRQFSGTGGASDFAYGAFHSRGGRGILAMTSTAKGGTVSKIQPVLTPGAVVSISRNLVDYVVTEYGIARLRNRTVRQRAENLIAVAHPDFRAELRREAGRLMLW